MKNFQIKPYSGYEEVGYLIHVDGFWSGITINVVKRVGEAGEISYGSGGHDGDFKGSAADRARNFAEALLKAAELLEELDKDAVAVT